MPGYPASRNARPCPPVPPDRGTTIVPPVPQSPSESTPGDEHTDAANVPADVQVCEPFWLVGHGHATVRPETYLAPSLPPPQPPRNATERIEARIGSQVVMPDMVAPSWISCNSGFGAVWNLAKAFKVLPREFLPPAAK